MFCSSPHLPASPLCLHSSCSSTTATTTTNTPVSESFIVSYPIASIPSLSLSSPPVFTTTTTNTPVSQSVSTSSTTASVSTALILSPPVLSLSVPPLPPLLPQLLFLSPPLLAPLLVMVSVDHSARATSSGNPEGIATSHTKFGIFLLNDETGDKVNIIEYKNRGDPESISRSILGEWLRGKGLLPVTWETLVKA
ncbi:hypothetical protein GBAR_LOCUS6078, partial [Geodia barretti]